jgi:hypothetical protein
MTGSTLVVGCHHRVAAPLTLTAFEYMFLHIVLTNTYDDVIGFGYEMNRIKKEIYMYIYIYQTNEL